MVSGCRLPSRLASDSCASRGVAGPRCSGLESCPHPFEHVSIRLPLLLSLAGRSDCHGQATPQEVVTDPTKRVPTACRKELVTARWKEVVTGRRKDCLPRRVKVIVPPTETLQRHWTTRPMQWSQTQPTTKRDTIAGNTDLGPSSPPQSPPAQVEQSRILLYRGQRTRKPSQARPAPLA